MNAYFLAPDGQIVAVPAEQAPMLAGARGYTPATPEQIAIAQAGEKYGGTGQQVAAGLEGLARGLSARLSTAAEVGLGVPAADIAGREQAHPATAIASEGAGIALPILATLGVAAPAEAAGQGAIRTAAAFTAPSLIARAGAAAGGAGVAGRAIAGATEGALFGIGNVIHEAALGDPDMTAQGVLAHVGLSAALGGGLGAVMGGAEIGIRAALGKARQAAGELATGIVTPAKLHGAVSAQHEAVTDALRLADSTLRPAEIAATLTTPPEIAQGELLRVVSRIDDVAANMRAHPELFPQPMYPAKLEAIRDSLIPRGLTEMPDATAEDVFTSLNDAKRSIDKQLGRWGKLISPEQQDSIAAVRGIRTELKTALENEGVWGEAGARQAAFNEARTAYSDSLGGDFGKTFMRKAAGRGMGPVYDVDPGKLSRLSDTANPRYSMWRETWDAHQQATRDLLDQIEVSHGTVPVGDFDRGALESLVNKSGEIEQAARKQGAVIKMLSRLGGVGPMATMAGGIVGGPAGAAVGAGIDLIAKGAKFIPHAVDVMTRLHAHNEAMLAAVEVAAGKMMSSGLRVARGEAAAGIGQAFGRSAEDTSARFAKQAEELRGIVGDPDRMHEALTGLADGLPSKTAQALTVAAARGAAFLASKLPPVVRPGPLSEALPPSQGDMARFQRYTEGLGSPASIIRMAAAGTLTPEHVEALVFVHPALLKPIRAALAERFASGKPLVPRARYGAMLLMGRDLDGSSTPDAILRNQMVFQRKPQQPQAPRAKAGKVTLPSRTLTSAQRAAGGEQ